MILPIILPGVITGVALASFFLFTHTDLSVRTVIIGHTTFCIVLVFNNVLARLRRVSPSLEEASRDLGASGLQTFWYVTLPTIRTALVAGALLSLALSFDEIAVTFFLAGADTTTLPLWILGAFRNARVAARGQCGRHGHPRDLAPDDRHRGLADARRGRRLAGGAGRVGRASGRGASVAGPCVSSSPAARSGTRDGSVPCCRRRCGCS